MPALAVLVCVVWIFVKDRATTMAELRQLTKDHREDHKALMNQVERIAADAHEKAAESYGKLAVAIDRLEQRQ